MTHPPLDLMVGHQKRDNYDSPAVTGYSPGGGNKDDMIEGEDDGGP